MSIIRALVKFNKCQQEDCQFHVGPEMTTDMYYPPIYDKYGNNTNPDRNVRSGEVSCGTCNRQWTYGYCGRESANASFSEVDRPNIEIPVRILDVCDTANNVIRSVADDSVLIDATENSKLYFCDFVRSIKESDDSGEGSGTSGTSSGASS